MDTNTKAYLVDPKFAELIAIFHKLTPEDQAEILAVVREKAWRNLSARCDKAAGDMARLRADHKEN